MSTPYPLLHVPPEFIARLRCSPPDTKLAGLVVLSKRDILAAELRVCSLLLLRKVGVNAVRARL